MKPIFKAKARKGQLFLKDPVSFKRHLLRFKDDTDVDVTVGRHEKTISDPLRKYYFKVVAQLIADDTGHSKDTVHESMKVKYASYVDKKTGLTIIESVFSNISTWSISRKKEFILFTVKKGHISIVIRSWRDP